MKIPWAIPNILEEDKKAVRRVLDSGWLSMGPEVHTFEKNLASYLDIDYAVAMNNGTSALDVALRCLDIRKDDEIMIPGLTYIATGAVVLQHHAIPVFVDIDETLNMDPEKVEEKITEKTKAIITIDLGGNPSNYSALTEISEQYGIPLLVDGAQSLGSLYKGRHCCTFGNMSTTSFHAAKILTTIEGGMVFTNDSELYQMAQAIRNQGDVAKFDHRFLGSNYRMIDLVAAIGNAQIRRFEKTLESRREKVMLYKEHLDGFEFPVELPQTRNCNFFFLILYDKRDELHNYLEKQGIETRITYPLPINEQPIFKQYCTEILPKAKEISQRVLSLPLYYSLTTEQQLYIVEHIKLFTK